MALAEVCYRVTENFHSEEVFGMTAQIRRSACSIPANIAEGYARETTASFIQFLRVARGSLRELETHLLLSQRVQIANEEAVSPALEKCNAVGRMLHGLIKSLHKPSDGSQ